MTINKFTGKTKEEAIECAKQAFGPNAVIMNIKEIKPKGLFGIFKSSTYEVTAAERLADILKDPALPVMEIPRELRAGDILLGEQQREAIELAKPVEGIITDRFDIRNGNFGVRIAAAASDRITAIDNGTVVLSLWTPETGYMVELQHANNLLSVYKGLSQSLVTTGQTIRAGEMVGYNAEAEEGEVRLFEFELWNNGKPVDPEGYIVF